MTNLLLWGSPPGATVGRTIVEINHVSLAVIRRARGGPSLGIYQQLAIVVMTNLLLWGRPPGGTVGCTIVEIIQHGLDEAAAGCPHVSWGQSLLKLFRLFASPANIKARVGPALAICQRLAIVMQ